MNAPTVLLVDDDAAVRAGISALLAAHGIAVKSYANAEELFAAITPDDVGCLLLDQNLPGMSGLDLQNALARKGIDLPIIFLTAYGDVPSTVQAMRAGAMDYLQKPPAADALIARIRSALTLDEERRAYRARRNRLRAEFESLTQRERDVMALAVAGLANKEIARKLGISHRTVETHRSRVMHKLNAGTLFDLIEIARACEVPTTATDNESGRRG